MPETQGHSPGPWHRVQADVGYDILDANGRPVVSSIGVERLADADIIAAAPMVYSALVATEQIVRNVLTDSQLDVAGPCGKTLRQWQRQVDYALKRSISHRLTKPGRHHPR